MTDPIDNEMGPGVRTVRHATAAPASEWVDAPTGDGVWWVLRPNGAIEVKDIHCRNPAEGDERLWHIDHMGSDDFDVFSVSAMAREFAGCRFAPAVPPAPPAPVLRFAHPAQVFTPFAYCAPEPTAFDEPQEIP